MRARTVKQPIWGGVCGFGRGMRFRTAEALLAEETGDASAVSDPKRGGVSVYGASTTCIDQTVTRASTWCFALSRPSGTELCARRGVRGVFGRTPPDMGGKECKNIQNKRLTPKTAPAGCVLPLRGGHGDKARQGKGLPLIPGLSGGWGGGHGRPRSAGRSPTGFGAVEV